jgi:hypothetical protein
MHRRPQRFERLPAPLVMISDHLYSRSTQRPDSPALAAAIAAIATIALGMWLSSA